MTRTIAEEVHKAAERRAAEEFRAKGYEVILEPTGSDLPEFLAGFQPDLIALGHNESIVVEVKLKNHASSSDQLLKLSDLARSHGWKFALYIADVSEDNVVPYVATVLDLDAAKARLSDARRALEELGVELRDAKLDAAFLSAWIAIEALLRSEAELEELPFERLPTTRLARELVSHGVVSQRVLNALLKAKPIRDRIVHGFSPEPSDEIPSALQSLVAACDELIADLEAHSGAKS